MPGRRRLALLGGLAALGLAGAVPWPVTAPVQWALDRSWRGTGLAPGVERAVWVPWRSLELTGFRLDPPIPGAVRAARVQVVPQWPWLALGKVRAVCRFEEVQLEMESERPIHLDGEGIVEWGWGKVSLERFSLEGPAVRLRAEGWLQAGRQAQLMLDGSLSRDLLRRMRWVEELDPGTEGWEPFRLRLDGALSRPRLEFTSRFLTFSMNVPADPAGGSPSS